MSHILRTSTEHKTASLADEGNSAYCQSSGAHNIKHISFLLREEKKEEDNWQRKNLFVYLFIYEFLLKTKNIYLFIYLLWYLFILFLLLFLLLT